MRFGALSAGASVLPQSENAKRIEMGRKIFRLFHNRDIFQWLQFFQLQLIIVLQIFMQRCQRMPDFLNLGEVKVAERGTCMYWNF